MNFSRCGATFSVRSGALSSSSQTTSKKFFVAAIMSLYDCFNSSLGKAIRMLSIGFPSSILLSTFPIRQRGACPRLSRSRLQFLQTLIIPNLPTLPDFSSRSIPAPRASDRDGNEAPFLFSYSLPFRLFRDYPKTAAKAV